MNIANISIRQPHLIAMMVLGLLVVGVIGCLRLPVDLLPLLTCHNVGIIAGASHQHGAGNRRCDGDSL